MDKKWLVKDSKAKDLYGREKYVLYNSYADAETAAKRAAANKAEVDVDIFELVAVARAPIPNIEIVKVA